MHDQTAVDEQIAAAEGEADLTFGGGTNDGDTLFAEGAAPHGLVEVPEGLSEEDAAAFVEKWKAEHELGPEAFDKLTDEEAAELAGPQMQVPVQNLVLDGARVSIMNGEDGEKAIVVGPVMLSVVLPLGAEGARAIARGLTGGIEIASSLPPKLEVAR